MNCIQLKDRAMKCLSREKNLQNTTNRLNQLFQTPLMEGGLTYRMIQLLAIHNFPMVGIPAFIYVNSYEMSTI